MNNIKTLTLGTFLASTLVATGAYAKGHGQGFTTDPGDDVFDETVSKAPPRVMEDGDKQRAASANPRMFEENEEPPVERPENTPSMHSMGRGKKN